MSEPRLLLTGHTKDLGGGFTVRRLLPALQQRAVGPFVFFDHFGPVEAGPARCAARCAAHSASVDRGRTTPYSIAASNVFDMAYSGGKRDDITCLVALMLKATNRAA